MEAKELEAAQRDLMEERVRLHAQRETEQRRDHEEAMKRLDLMHKRETVMLESRIRDLEAQNDALLGAVGRLHTFQAKAESLEREIEYVRREREIQMHQIEQEMLRLKEELKRAKAGKTGGD